MASTKNRSAAQRREQVRRQRVQHDSQNTQRQQTKTSKVRRVVRRGINPWWYIGSVLAVVVIVVGIFIYVANQQGNVAKSGTTDTTVLQQVTHVSPTLLSQVGTADVKNNFQAVKQKQPIQMGPTGKPEFLYYGAEFCPYCAGQRWGVVVALSRFGTFTKLPEIASSSSDVYPNTATFSFYKSSYTSNYIDFVPLEVEDGQGQPLQTMTPDQQKLVNTYNAPPYTQSPGFPFIDIGNQYIVAGPTYSPDVLAGLSQKDIASQLSSTDSDVSKKIMATANYMTAGVCLITNNKPDNVCNDPTIQQIAQSMPKPTAMNTGNSQRANINASFDVIVSTRQRA
ncbi:MAG: hypothetical protein NVS4B12_03040 [Ktedonobacteraceae bacterium]